MSKAVVIAADFFVLTENLVPDIGNSETVFGEMLRAINRILYRWENDGDRFSERYGIETCGSSAIYLSQICPLKSLFEPVLFKAECRNDDNEYYAEVEKLANIIVNPKFVSKEEREKLISEKNTINSRDDFSEKAIAKWGNPDAEFYDDEDE
jgi:hypothetical protein